MTSKKTIVNGENLYYFDTENGAATLLFIHGAFINKEYWNAQIEFFKKKYRVIAIDLSGHGKSTFNRNEFNMQDFGIDISEFIEILKLKNVIIIGHSFGSDLMLEAVSNNSNEIIGLVEIDHLKNVGFELPDEVKDFLVGGLNTDFDATCEQIARQGLYTEATNQDIVTKLLSDYKNMNPKIGIPLLTASFNYSKREVELLEKLKLKLHSIHVTYSPTNKESLSKYLGNNYHLHYINGTCHYPMIENPTDFNETLEKIIVDILN